MFYSHYRDARMLTHEGYEDGRRRERGEIQGGLLPAPAACRRCLDRVSVLLKGKTDLALLEPSAGDGAFVRGLLDHVIGIDVTSIVAIEIIPSEVAACRRSVNDLAAIGRVLEESAIAWAARTYESFDVAVGNPHSFDFSSWTTPTKPLTTCLAARYIVRRCVQSLDSCLLGSA